MRHENNFERICLPDGEGLRINVAVIGPRDACECATAWIGEADAVLELISSSLLITIIEQARLLGSDNRHAAIITDTSQSILSLMTLARREMALAKGVAGALYGALPDEQREA
ncbi:hypothetical protein V474_22810 [Novosphingobium barchaimii LL02]|uniref:Uncharacterized protein n=1 Tax=Novosphingobium barchaimii LL02 TaxID=1114963 RepID=A0A0J7XPR7_9SPHN|nr:hypothetical protein [Novosphingobium barchaimii]KMS53614.1 hypothetical protein V474_22810 [Novosphingobium barchaimii LL02]